jgi:hypothetical protein
MSVRKLILVVGMLGVLLMASAALAATTRFSGTISSGAQFDRYSLSYRAGQSLVADLTCDDPATLDPVLSLYDGSNTLVAYNDDGGIKPCNAFRSSRIVFTIPETGTYTWQVDGFGSSTGTYTLSIADGVAGFVPSDDRINPHAFAPVAVYCRDAGSVEVWNIDSAGQGTVLFNVSGADVTAGANGAALHSAGAVTLSKLSDGRLQVSAPMLDGKGYLFIFNGCPVHSSETYTVENGNAVLFETRSY